MREETGMRIIEGSRCSGRTTALIMLAAIEGAVIICPTLDRAKSVKENASKMGYEVETMCIAELARRESCEPQKKYCFDDLDVILEMGTHGKACGATVLSPSRISAKEFVYDETLPHFEKMAECILGKDYLSDGMGVYKLNEFVCKDIEKEHKWVCLKYKVCRWLNVALIMALIFMNCMRVAGATG